MPTKTKIPKSEYAAIRKLRASGMTLERIAKFYGVRRQRIWAILKTGR